MTTETLDERIERLVLKLYHENKEFQSILDSIEPTQGSEVLTRGGVI